jgi:hypothetical protein
MDKDEGLVAFCAQGREREQEGSKGFFSARIERRGADCGDGFVIEVTRSNRPVERVFQCAGHAECILGRANNDAIGLLDGFFKPDHCLSIIKARTEMRYFVQALKYLEIGIRR